MINKVGYWEHMVEIESAKHNSFLLKNKQRLDKLLNIDILTIPDQDQQKHYDRIKYLQDVIEKFTSMQNMLINIKECYWASLDELVNENNELSRQIMTLTTSNKFLLSRLPKLKIKIN